jgi:hypothetical protein
VLYLLQLLFLWGLFFGHHLRCSYNFTQIFFPVSSSRNDTVLETQAPSTPILLVGPQGPTPRTRHDLHCSLPAKTHIDSRPDSGGRQTSVVHLRTRSSHVQGAIEDEPINHSLPMPQPRLLDVETNDGSFTHDDPNVFNRYQTSLPTCRLEDVSMQSSFALHPYVRSGIILP